MFGAIPADSHVSGKRLGFDVIGKALNGFGNTRRRFKVDPDAVGDFESGILSHILHTVDELAREALIDEFRCERSIERHRQAAAGFHEPALNTLSGNGHILTCYGDWRTVDFRGERARLVQLHGFRRRHFFNPPGNGVHHLSEFRSDDFEIRGRGFAHNR